MAVAPSSSQAGLSNTSAARSFVTTEAGGAGFEHRSLSIRECDDDPGIRERYRPFLLDKEGNEADWIDDLELGTVMTMAAENMQRTGDRLKVLVLFGSLRQRWANRRAIGPFVQGFGEKRRVDKLRRSYSRFTAFEASRVLFRLGCDVRVYDPTGLPVKDDVQHQHEKVQELRELSRWSDGHVWVSPEQHGNLVRDPCCCSSRHDLQLFCPPFRLSRQAVAAEISRLVT